MTEKTTQEPMTGDRFRALIECYGASAAHWPIEERAAAQAFFATHAEARALMDEEVWLDRLLDAVPHAQPSEAFKQGLLPRRLPRARSAWVSRVFAALWPEASVSWPAGVLAASTALGILIGLATPAIDVASRDLNAGEVVSYAFSALDTSDWL
jgi:hypothetical protein